MKTSGTAKPVRKSASSALAKRLGPKVRAGHSVAIAVSIKPPAH